MLFISLIFSLFHYFRHFHYLFSLYFAISIDFADYFIFACQRHAALRRAMPFIFQPPAKRCAPFAMPAAALRHFRRHFIISLFRHFADHCRFSLLILMPFRVYLRCRHDIDFSRHC
jgi:hypothetical protein